MIDASNVLNPAQREAVEHRDGPIEILAGPGSGKTRVMTHRIAHLMASEVTGRSILAITFTNKAADEMLQRTVSLLGEAPVTSAGAPVIRTFHSFCASLLRQEIHQLPPYQGSFHIYDTVDQRAVVEEALHALSLDRSTFPPRGCLAQISHWKNNMIGYEQAFDDAETHRTRQLARVFKSYQERLEQRNAVDFDDLLLLTLRVLREIPEVRDRRARMHRYLLIDEFQDTNRPQYLIARLLAAEHRNLCITGDPDQSIYSWRGASPENFARFAEDFPEHKVVCLDQNYRSTPQILAAASRLTGGGRGSRTLFTRNHPGEEIEVRRVLDEHREAQVIAECALEWQRQGMPLGEIAVLYRINALSRTIEEALIRERIPYVVVGGTAFYQRKEVKDILCYLRAAAHEEDELALRRVINTPPRGIGPVTLDRLEDAARAAGLPLGRTLSNPELWQGVRGRSRGALEEFLAVLRALRSLRGAPLHRLVEAAIEETGYLKYLERSEPESWRERSQNLEELVSAAAEAEELLRLAGRTGSGGIDSLDYFLERVALVTDIDRWDEQQDRLALMTLHSAKGLEFDRVIIVGVEDSLLPHTRSDEPHSEDEERRLLYVGITRARHSVLVLHAAWRRRFRYQEPRLPSPFLDELLGSGVRSIEEQSAREIRERARGAVLGAAEEYGDHSDEDDELAVGVLLDHDTLGRGVITATSGFGELKRITVRFEEHGEKQLVAAYAPLRIIQGRAEA